jgi:hypothetical protein
MTPSKKVFIFLVVVFIIFLGWASYDIATRTTFPGSKPQLRERLKERFDKPTENLEDTLNFPGDSSARPQLPQQFSD